MRKIKLIYNQKYYGVFNLVLALKREKTYKISHQFLNWIRNFNTFEFNIDRILENNQK